MKQNNQILSIKEFISSNEENIVINRISDELEKFYISIFNHYAQKENIKLEINNDFENQKTNDDLFGQKKIKVLNTTNTKKINEVLKINYKKIIFTDYKNFKILNSKYNSINGYKFELDISFFLKDELRINSDKLLYYCKNNPVLLFSEISKYLINSNNYTNEQNIVDEKNHILSIRKSIFENKKNNFNIKNLYSNIKKEAEYKKLSFLIY